MSAPLRFDDFQIDAPLGSNVQRVDPALLSGWKEIYGSSAETRAPVGVVSVLAMRSYAAVVTPRPDGNIHANQSFNVHQPLQAGERVVVSYRCVEKFMKKERRFVRFEGKAIGADDGRPRFDASMLIIWGA